MINYANDAKSQLIYAEIQMFHVICKDLAFLEGMLIDQPLSWSMG